jgi:RNA polymerase sigma-70 factor, ECF subfamily
MTTASTEPEATLTANGDLIAACVRGDRDAREKLARACLPRVRRTVFFGTGGGPDCDDLTQTVMMRAFASLAAFRGESGFDTWLDRIAVRAVCDHFRRNPFRSLFARLTEQAEPETRPADGPERLAESREIVALVARHLSRIGARKRMALVLHAAYGYSTGEIGLIMECSEETAKKRVQHGRAELLSRLLKDEACRGMLQEMAR